MAEFKQRYRTQPTQLGRAFPPCRLRGLDLAFSIQHMRTVAGDNTVQLGVLAAGLTHRLARQLSWLPGHFVRASG